jgi:hypothetical protein
MNAPRYGKERNTIKRNRVRARHLSITSLGRRNSKVILCIGIILLLRIRAARRRGLRGRMDPLIGAISSYLDMTREPAAVSVDRNLPIRIDFNYFSETVCRANFVFLKEDLIRLKACLRMPELFKTINKCCFSCEEALLIFLYRWHRGGTYDEMSRMFGRDDTQLVRIVHEFGEWLVNTWGHLLMDNIRYFVPFFPRYSEAIRIKGENVTGFHLFEPNEQRIVAAIDGTATSIRRPGGDNNYQKCMYSAYHGHCTNSQGVGAPDGMLIDFYSPGRGNDLNALRDSHILEFWDAAQAVPDGEGGLVLLDEIYSMYGDKIYPYARKGITRAHLGNMLTVREEAEDETFKVVRVNIIEHIFGKLNSLWEYNGQWNKIDLKRHANHKMVTFISALLTNMHTCLYGGQVSTYFNCSPPTLEAYFSNRV